MREIASLSVLAAMVGLVASCDNADVDEAANAQRHATLVACHLDDGTVGRDDDLRACDPQSTKKTTICHIPPGNPANAHTLCIGNPGVPAHLRNHGDYLGPCKREITCPPPVVPGTGGTVGTGGQAGSPDSGAVAGTGGTGGVSTGGTGGVIE